jgi:predicted RNase H-like nuclease (RuvC/YqgF family)
MTEARDYYKDKYKKLDDFYESSKVFNDSMYEGRDDRVKELEIELEKEKETYDMLAKDYDIMRRSAQKSGALNNLSVTVNGERYKII